MEGSIRMNKTPPFCKKTDWWIVGILFLITLIACALFPRRAGETAVIRLDGEPTHTLSLLENKEITLKNKGVRLTVCVENGAAQVKESTCPDGICRRIGAIETAGQTIVCLPAACSITVEGAPAKVDGVTY